MTEPHDRVPESPRAATATWRVITRSVLRAAGSVIALVTIYYLLPLNTSVTWAAITILVAGLVVLVALVVYYVRSIRRSPFPGLRAFEALAVTVPVFLLLFASTYVVMDRMSPASFTQSLTHTDALYFAVTVFTTVGFGDITARTEAARLVVTVQMIADVIIIGVAIQAIVSAARQGRQRLSAKPLLPCRRPQDLLQRSAPARRAVMLGVAMQAPLAGLALILELTGGGFAIMIPMVAATVAATAVARYVDGYSIYSARLRARPA